jgi:hypothetical protein
MSMDYINRYYCKDYSVGMKIIFNGRPCTITGAEGAYLLATTDGKDQLILHPTWRIELPQNQEDTPCD